MPPLAGRSEMESTGNSEASGLGRNHESVGPSDSWHVMVTGVHQNPDGRNLL